MLIAFITDYVQRYATKQAAEDAANGAGEESEEEEEESESEDDSDDEDEATGDSESFSMVIYVHTMEPAFLTNFSSLMPSVSPSCSGIMTALQAWSSKQHQCNLSII